MEKADIKKKVHLALVALLISVQKGTGFSTVPLDLPSCASLTANIYFNFSIDATESIIGKRIWFLGSGKIAESNGTTLTPVASYSSRLTAYGTDGISLSNVIAADAGTYTYVIVLSPTASPFTATTTLLVREPPLPPPSCQVTVNQSSNILSCAVSGNCGTPSLNAFWVNSTNTANQMECNAGMTYQCCATSAALACYTGSPNDFCKLLNCTAVLTTMTPSSGNCQLVLILCLVLVLIIPAVFIIIIIVILKYTDDEHAYTLGLVVGISFGITFIVCCIIIAILICTGITPCKLELGLALVLLLGIICIIICIIALIFRCSSIPQNKGKPKRVKFGEGIHRGFLYSTGIGFIVVYFVCTKDKDNQEDTDEVPPVETCVGTDANFSFTVTEDCKESEVVIKNKSGRIVMTVHGKKVKSDDSLYKDRVTFTGDMKQMQISFILRNVTLEDAGIYTAVLTNPVKTIGRTKLIVKALKKSKTNNSGPPAVHTGTQNKVDPYTSSKQTNVRQQPLPPVNTGFEDTPTIRPQPPPPQNGEIKDRNLRGISATIGDTLDLASETPRPIKLPPLTTPQATVQREDASEEPKKKRKKKKKKDQINEETPEEENGKTNLRVN
ncbi:hypothetical protein ACJMK2_007033 [Sinanodonta woodiana]|uniref:Ig-like domain-containing protein n=1 Tax=Sinanodonta woodiana TaxID=1069815 RepID=A0ABD3VK64_SINWO